MLCVHIEIDAYPNHGNNGIGVLLFVTIQKKDALISSCCYYVLHSSSMNVEYVFGVSIISLTAQSLVDIIALSTITSNERGEGELYFVWCSQRKRVWEFFFESATEFYGHCNERIKIRY